jgi:hypothetical protein
MRTTRSSSSGRTKSTDKLDLTQRRSTRLAATETVDEEMPAEDLSKKRKIAPDLPAPTPGKRNTRSKVADPEAPATGNRRRTRSVAEQEETAAGAKDPKKPKAEDATVTYPVVTPGPAPKPLVNADAPKEKSPLFKTLLHAPKEKSPVEKSLRHELRQGDVESPAAFLQRTNTSGQSISSSSPESSSFAQIHHPLSAYSQTHHPLSHRSSAPSVTAEIVAVSGQIAFVPDASFERSCFALFIRFVSNLHVYVRQSR